MMTCSCRITLKNNSPKVLDDTWMYDFSAQTWSAMSFQQNFQYVSQDCVSTIGNTLLPGPRAGHSVVGASSFALMCGGFSSFNGSLHMYQNDSDILDCFWFSLDPFLQWKPLKTVGQTAPTQRWGHSMAYSTLGIIVVFGGVSKATQNALGDCWFIDSSVNPFSGGQYVWKSCNPPPGKSLQPAPRFGHQSVIYSNSQTLYVYAGFAFNGLNGIVVHDDMWILQNFNQPEVSQWKRIMAATNKPAARAFFSMWLEGFTIYVHGGQGPGGTGLSSVFSDTWHYNILTNSWKQYPVSEAAPSATQIAVFQSKSSSGHVVSFGGMLADGLPSGYVGSFSPADGWSKVLPSGNHPVARSGHMALYDESASKMIVTLGLTVGPELLDDLWELDLELLTWTCLQGSQTSCRAAVTGHGPGKLAHAASSSFGLGALTFGGITSTSASCAGQSYAAQTFLATSNTWMIDLESLSWLRINTGTLKPNARVFSAMAVVGQVSTLKNAVLVLGGATWDCFHASPKCTVPQPLNDVWVIDMARKETFPGEMMATFDGVDDFISVQLPSWYPVFAI
eukprot:765270-Hanusia_phi.AAC.3